MATVSFYPSVTDPVDGQASREVATPFESWATLRAGAGNLANYANDRFYASAAPGSIDSTWGKLRRGIVMFDTSSLGSGATITAATLRLRGISRHDQDGLNTPTVNVYGATPAGTSSIVAADFGQCGATAFCDTDLTYANFNNAGGINDFILNAAGLAAISKTGVTKFSVRLAKYDVGSTTPTWYSGIWALGFIFFSVDYSGGQYTPELIVTYTPVAPTVRTDPATLVTKITATLNGYLTNQGSEAASCYFQWGTTTAYGNTTTAVSKTTGQSFSAAITGLTEGTEYHFRAVATNQYGTGYGEDLTFTTLNVVWPSEATIRVSALVHRWSPGNYTLEIIMGGYSTKYGLPIITKRPIPALPDVETEETVKQTEWMRTWYIRKAERGE